MGIVGNTQLATELTKQNNKNSIGYSDRDTSREKAVVINYTHCYNTTYNFPFT